MGVLHVKSATHNANSNTVGTIDTPGDPYGLEAAFDNAVAGDEIRIWADGTYTWHAIYYVNTNAGTASSPIYVNGANASGVVDGTKPHLQASTAQNTMLGNGGSSIIYWYFSHLNFDANNNARRCVYEAYASTSSYWRWTSCDFHDTSINECYSVRCSYRTFVGCRFYNAGGNGGFMNYSTGGHVGCVFIACESFDNTGMGFQTGTSRIYFINCLAYRNSTHGFMGQDGQTNNSILYSGCVAYDNGGDGFRWLDLDWIEAFNCSSVSNGGYGYNVSTYPTGSIDHNHSHGNTSGHTDAGTGLLADMAGENNVEGDPLFLDPDAATPDFTPAVASPLFAAGLGV